jgi:hypothetical protein
MEIVVVGKKDTCALQTRTAGNLLSIRTTIGHTQRDINIALLNFL